MKISDMFLSQLERLTDDRDSCYVFYIDAIQTTEASLVQQTENVVKDVTQTTVYFV